MHPLEVGADRYLQALTDPAFESGRFYASPEGQMTGAVVDQGTFFGDLRKRAYQDNAHAALGRLLG